MRRRRYLTLCSGATAGLAGCSALFSNSDDGSVSTSTPSPSGRSNTSSDEDKGTATSSASATASLVAEVDSLQPAVVTRTTTDAIGIRNRDGRQYLYLDVTVERGESPSYDELRVRFDGQQYSPADRSGLWREYRDTDGRYDAASGEGWVLFSLPETGDASDVALLREGGDGTWPIVSQPSVNFDGQLSTASPPLSLEMSVPGEVESGTTPTLSVTVANEGERDGTFVGALNRSGPSVDTAPVTAISQVVPPGEPTSFEITDETAINSSDDELDDGESDLTYDLRWTGGERSHDIRLVDSSTGN